MIFLIIALDIIDLPLNTDILFNSLYRILYLHKIYLLHSASFKENFQVYQLKLLYSENQLVQLERASYIVKCGKYSPEAGCIKLLITFLITVLQLNSDQVQNTLF